MGGREETQAGCSGGMTCLLTTEPWQSRANSREGASLCRVEPATLGNGECRRPPAGGRACGSVARYSHVAGQALTPEHPEAYLGMHPTAPTSGITE